MNVKIRVNPRNPWSLLLTNHEPAQLPSQTKTQKICHPEEFKHGA